VNKKLVLSVLSTAVVASMAASAMAKPDAGFYVGGQVDKYYNIDAFFNHFDEALDEIVDNLDSTTYVDADGNAASFQDILTANGDLSKVMKPARLDHFEKNPYAIVDGEGTWNPEEDDELLPPVDGGELKVESVSTITKYGVEIKFEALTEAKTNVTVQVKDNKGNVVAVVPQDLAKGETSASFDFVTPLTADPEGVWTVNGVQYDFNAVKHFNDIVAAAQSGNEVKTLAALNAAGLTDVKEENIPDYVQAIQDAANNGELETLADIQTLIIKVNADSISKDEEAAVVKAVVEATNQVQLLAALQNKAFARVNADWIKEYQQAITGAIATINSVEDIQNVVDGVNLAQINVADSDAKTSAEQNAVTALIQKYMKDDEGTATDKANKIKDSQIKAAVFKVAEASTQTSVYSALTALAALDPDNLPASSLNMYLKAEYLAAQALYKGSIDASSPTAVEDIFNNIVKKAASDALADALDTVNNLTKNSAAADVKAALQRLANVTSHETNEADKFDMSTVKDALLVKYAEEIEQKAPTDLAGVKAAIAKVNANSDIEGSLETINSKASTAADVKAALLEIALSKGFNDYIDAPSQVQLEVAQLVIDNRPAGGYDKLDDILDDSGDGALKEQLDAHADRVQKFNNIGNLANATTSDVKAALDAYKYAGYVSLTNTQKVAVAQEILKLTKDVDGKATPLNFAGEDAVKSFKEADDYIKAAIAAAGF
jgi:trimeric autotransporter adhesin